MADVSSSDVSSDTTTDSSDDGSSSASASPRQQGSPVRTAQPAATVQVPAPEEHADSASDVSMSADSDSDDEHMDAPKSLIVNSTIQQQGQVTPIPVGDDSTRKRKLDSPHAQSQADEPQAPESDSHKRVKLEPVSGSTSGKKLPVDMSLLPAELWHHIFSYTPPRALGRLLRVNKLFNAYLDPSSHTNPSIPEPLPKTVFPLLSPGEIWQSSRRLFRPAMPAPLAGTSELDMWKLAGGLSCQFCGKKGEPVSASFDHWHAGPGENGVAPVWAFGFRTCGPCLPKQTLKEIDLLLSSSVPSDLLKALPFVLLSNELHVIPTSALQSGPAPLNLQWTKLYLRTQVDDIKAEFMKVKDMGSGTAEEWSKGLEERGKERLQDALRLEKWASAGGLRQIRSLEASELPMPSATALNVSQPKPVAPPVLSIPVPMKPVQTQNGHHQNGHPQNGHPLNGPPHIVHPLPKLEAYLPVQPIPATYIPTTTSPRYGSPANNGFPPHMRQFQPPRHERTKEEVAELKAARRAEIERRCMLLDPPLTANVLAHMASFQAAIQIIKPLDDNSWEMLKPRLLSQREEAEQRENDRIAQSKVSLERFDRPYLEGAKDLTERDWDDFQAPLRSRIGGFADEIISGDSWRGGDKVTKENSPRFAAEVLMYVRKRFYAEIAKDEAAARAAGQEPPTDPPEGPFTRKLVLENMKWVFDTKIKPHTEQYRKELFLCNGCENNFKYYGFEGVIQHFAAKHTNSLSVGSIVVHWRAEWPEHPPFNPDPTATKSSHYATGPVPRDPWVPGSQNNHSSYGFGGYPPASGPPPSNVYQPGPGPYYGHPGVEEQHIPQPITGPFYPPPAHQNAPGYQGGQYANHPPNNYPPAVSGPDYGPQGYSTMYQGPGYPPYEQPHVQPYGSSMPESSNQQSTYGPPNGQYASSYAQGASYGATAPHDMGPHSAAIQETEAYRSQLEDVSRNAKDLWTSTAGIREFPGSIRVQVVIHHLLKRNRLKFPNDPPLKMLIEGLSYNKEMRPVRNVNGLACKVCSTASANFNLYPTRSSDKKLFSLPQLLNHFQSTHIGVDPVSHYEAYGVQTPDWTRDMIELPDVTVIADLANASGMDSRKLGLIKDALPEAFRPGALPQRRPSIGYQQPHAQMYREPERERDQYAELEPSRDNHERYYRRAPDSPREIPDITPRGDRRDPRDDAKVSAQSDRRYLSNEMPARYAEEDRSHTYLTRGPSPPRQRVSIDEYDRAVGRDAPSDPKDSSWMYEPGAPPRQRVPEKSWEERMNDRTFITNQQPLLADSPERRETVSSRPQREVPGSRGQGMPPQSPTSAITRVADQLRSDRVRAPSAQPSRNDRTEAVEAGSEDGELRANPASVPKKAAAEAGTADAQKSAERFLNELLPEATTRSSVRDAPLNPGPERRPEEVRQRPEAATDDNGYPLYDPGQPDYRTRSQYESDTQYLLSLQRDATTAGHVSRERAPPQYYAYADDDPYADRRQGAGVQYARERSPELVDRRYVQNNVVYREERQGSASMNRAPSRYARYESVRLENDRARSRSPVYVRVESQPGQYRQRSPPPQAEHEPIYRTRSPQQRQEIAYERVPRQEFYTIYEDPRPRRPEYMQINEQGQYVIRRPMHPDERLYASYDGAREPEAYARQPVFETRAPVSRSDPAYYEEYDPRHPAPPPPTTMRQVRYP